MSETYFPRWRKVTSVASNAVVQPNEYLPAPQSVAMAAQHVVAMFGSTILAPLLMGFDPNLAILMSGVGTLIFFIFVGGRVPSYLGSSFAFIGGVIAVTGYAGSGANPNIGVALGAIIVCGLVYTLIGLLVWIADARSGGAAHLINKMMPPVVTGAIVAFRSVGAGYYVQSINLGTYIVSDGLSQSGRVVAVWHSAQAGFKIGTQP